MSQNHLKNYVYVWMAGEPEGELSSLYCVCEWLAYHVYHGSQGKESSHEL